MAEGVVLGCCTRISTTTAMTALVSPRVPRVACHEHGTGLTGFLPASWDHLGCQSWDHPARLVGGSCVRSLTRHVACSDVEVISGIQGGQCG